MLLKNNKYFFFLFVPFVLVLFTGFLNPVYSAEQVINPNPQSMQDYYSDAGETDTGNREIKSELTDPDDANANIITGLKNAAITAKEIYSAYRSFSDANSEDANKNFWVMTFLKEGGDVVTMAICDKYQEDAFNTGCTSKDYENLNVGVGMRREGGLGQMASSIIQSAVNEPPVPTDLALFLRDTVDDTIFGTPSYAQGPLNVAPFRSVTYELWKVVRNFALLLVGIMIAIGGFMIMFRQKLSAQVTVSIYNLLPVVPIALVLIFLSYPIVAIAQSAIYPLVSVVINLLTDVANQVIPALQTSSQALINATISNSLNDLLGIVGVWLVYTFAFVMIMFSLIIGLVIALIVAIINLVKIVVDLFLLSVFSPLAFAMAIIPGKQGIITNIFKKLLINIIALPIGLFILGFGLIVAAVPTTDVINGGGFIGIPGMWFGYAIMTVIIKFVIGITIMLNAFKIRGLLESSFNVGGMFSDGAKPKR